jgi:hypothetical protein
MNVELIIAGLGLVTATNRFGRSGLRSFQVEGAT